MNSVLMKGKSGFDVIRFAFKRLPNQELLRNREGEAVPEPDYNSEEWRGWETRLTQQRADEVLDIKKEESPDLYENPNDRDQNVYHSLERIISVKMEED